MNKFLLVTVITLSSNIAFAQVSANDGHLLAQTYSKAITQYEVKEFIITEVLKVNENEIIEVQIDAITASKSGELTTVIYDCKSLKKSGVVLAFYSEQINDFNLRYKGYRFRNIEFDKAQDMFNRIEAVIEQKDDMLSKGEDNMNNVVYRWEDLTFLFSAPSVEVRSLRVFWDGFDAEWSPQNEKLTKKRFEKFFRVKKK